MKKLLALLVIAALVGAIAPVIADGPALAPCQSPWVQITEDVKVTGDFTYTEKFVWTYDQIIDYCHAYNTTTGTCVSPLVSPPGGAKLDEDVSYSSTLGTLHFVVSKVVDINGSQAGTNLKEEITAQFQTSGGQLQWRKSYGNSAMHAAIGEAGTVTALNEKESIKVWITGSVCDYVGSSEDLPRMEFSTTKSGTGSTAIGAIWYWNPAHVDETFFHKETASGSWEITKTIIFDYYCRVTKPTAAVARPHPAAPVP